MPIAFILLRARDEYPWKSVSEGLKKFGYDIYMGYDRKKADEESLLITWNCYGGSAVNAKGFPGTHIVMENGYMRRKWGYYAMGLNGVHGRDQIKFNNMPHDRWNKLQLTLEPWQTNGEYILVCAQRGGGFNDLAMPNEWPDEIIFQLREVTDRQIYYRPHPGRQRRLKYKHKNVIDIGHETPIEEHFKKAYATVVFTSNSVTDSLLHGVPVFYCGPTVACEPLAISLHNPPFNRINSPIHRDRESFFYDLAWRQWNLEEIQKGFAWECLLNA